MNLLDEQIINNFEQLQKDVVECIKGYGIELTHLSKQLDIDRGLLYRRIKNLDFTPTELRKIVKFLNNPIPIKKSGN
jgi:predicted transcriptional regulator